VIAKTIWQSSQIPVLLCGTGFSDKLAARCLANGRRPLNPPPPAPFPQHVFQRVKEQSCALIREHPEQMRMEQAKAEVLIDYYAKMNDWESPENAVDF